MKKVIFTALALSLLGTPAALADEVNDAELDMTEAAAPKDTVKASAGATAVAGNDRNVMLNAESSSSPRTINIGIPIGADLVIEENAAPVVYYFYPTIPIATWRKDESIGSSGLLTFGQTAIKTGKVGLSVETEDRHATNKMRGYTSVYADHFGSSRYNVALTGPLAKGGWGYMVDFYQNNERANGTDWKFTPWKDRTTMAKVGIEKKYKNGNIRLLYKFTSFKYILTNYSPMIYESDGKTKEYEGFKIGKDAFIVGSGMVPYYDLYERDAEGNPIPRMADISSDEYLEAQSHTVYLTGEHRFRGGLLDKWKANYTLSFMHDNAPQVVNFPLSLGAMMPDQQGNDQFFYHGTTNQYNGSVAYVVGNLMSHSNNNYFTARGELTRKFRTQNWKLGLQLQHYHQKFDVKTSAFYTTVEPNPQLLDYVMGYEAAPGYIVPVPMSNAENGALIPAFAGGLGSRTDDYYTKAAIYASDNIKLTPKWDLELGLRAELQNLRAHKVAPGYDVSRNYQNFTEAEKFNHNFGNNLNYAATFNTMYKAGRNWGLLADGTILSWKETYWDYECRDDNNLPTPAADGLIRLNKPGTYRSTVSNIGAGVYLNIGSYAQIVSKVLLTRKNNIRYGDAVITNPNDLSERTDCGPIYYDMSTLGWTTDIMANPFKNFNLHFLVTLQQPKYKNFEYSAYGVNYNYSDNTITSLSKFLMEIDPSYTIGKARLWVSLRYFGKQYGNMTNAFYYDGWWENFGGVDLNFSRNFQLKFQVTNFLDQAGVKGDIRGADQVTSAKDYYGRILMASGIRPRTFEVTANFKF